MLIREALLQSEVEHARRLISEYADWLRLDLSFQHFQEELDQLPGEYASPRGCCFWRGREWNPLGAWHFDHLRIRSAKCGSDLRNEAALRAGSLSGRWIWKRTRAAHHYGGSKD